MKIRDSQRALAIERLAAHVLATGLSQTSLRQLAAAAGISDRMLLYYFADKAEVLACVIGHIVDGFGAALDAALPAQPMAAAVLLAETSRVVGSPDLQPAMRLWLQIVAAAARQEPPFPALASAILQRFLAWIHARLDLPPGPERHEAAAFILAVIDGIALFDLAGGADLAAAARARMERHGHQGDGMFQGPHT